METSDNIKIEYSASKNGSKTCSVNGIFLHSKYNPENEAKLFVQSVVQTEKSEFSPACIIVIEPALSFCLPFLRENFPKAKLVAIRIIRDFFKTQGDWDEEFLFDRKTSLSQKILNVLGEELLLSSVQTEWKACARIFEGEFFNIWSEIKSAILKSRDILSTREFFASRWFLNSLNFFKFTEKIYSFSKISLPVVITASGPSLKSSLPKIKERRNSIFLISLSSSFRVLLENGIIPDIVMSCDGGFWSKFHLSYAGKQISENNEALKEIFFAVADENCTPKKLLEEKKIIPLCYEKSSGEILFKSLSIPFMHAERNGTVSGTALKFALGITEKNIYFSGLDLCPNDAFQHTQPNSLEIRDSTNDFRLKTAETRISVSRFRSEGSLLIYREWFSAQNKNELARVFRISDDFKYEFKINSMNDVNWNFFDKKENFPCQNSGETRCSALSSLKSYEKNTKAKEYNKKLEEKVNEILESDEFEKEIFPLEKILLERTTDNTEKAEIQKKLNQKKSNLQKKAEKILNGF